MPKTASTPSCTTASSRDRQLPPAFPRILSKTGAGRFCRPPLTAWDAVYSLSYQLCFLVFAETAEHRLFDRAEDVLIARAAAQMAGQQLAQLRTARTDAIEAVVKAEAQQQARDKWNAARQQLQQLEAQRPAMQAQAQRLEQARRARDLVQPKWQAYQAEHARREELTGQAIENF